MSIKYLVLSFFMAVMVIAAIPALLIFGINMGEVLLYLTSREAGMQLTHWPITLFSSTYSLSLLTLIIYTILKKS